MKTLHSHHLIPRHMGGTDEESNLVHGLSITRHAMFHFANWQLWGSRWDYIAWKTLSGQISSEEFSFEMKSAAGKKGSAVTNERYREEKKIWCAKSGRNQPREVKIANGKKVAEWLKNNPEESIKARKKANIACQKPVKITCLSSNESYEFESVKAAAKFVGVSSGNLSNILVGRQRWTQPFKAEFLK